MKQILALLFLLLTVFIANAQQSADQLFERGYNYLTADRSKAIELLSECIKEDPAYEKAYYHRGIAYFKNGEYEKALADFNKAQELSPKLSILWMYKGFTYRNMGKLDEAVNSFSNYISKNPTDTSAYSYILRGRMKYELGDFQGAVKDYDLAIRLRPFEEKYQYYRFIALYDNGQYKEALEAVRRLTVLNQDFYGYYYYKGNVFQKLGRYDSAVFMYNIAILKNSRNADSYFGRGKAYLELYRPDRAEEDLSKAIELDPKEPSYYAERGNIRYSENDLEGACADWNTANSMGYYKDYSTFRERCE
ncbi:tetratricopeptide repeat protein [Fulvivirga sedimenti]|uniref:Tetratricopeptide repeat protein n=1 Tax=Fulvivirga sedimenti TaxID=2879465 RepID=A0A9X1HMF2_9BACT|nr:tetratricopeptide repeat protein [Fulvivirga sedimenti]MCA6073272.1 tetratricopeptide repeat protein [Fulvivirga sedimenti]